MELKLHANATTTPKDQGLYSGQQGFGRGAGPGIVLNNLTEHHTFAGAEEP
jgi:hypothetical protein